MEPSGNVARGAGLELILRSAFYEDATVDGEDRQRWITMLFGARARSLGQAVFTLADAGRPQEAAVLIRSMSEYLITLAWLRLDFEAHDLVWQLDDLRSTLTLADEAAKAGLPIISEENKEVFEREKERLRARLDGLENINDRVPEGNRERLPGFEQRAQASGLGPLYAVAYRWDSLAAAHPNATALQQPLDRVGTNVVVRTSPTEALPEPYAIGTWLLATTLTTIAETYQDLEVPGLAELVREIPGLAEIVAD